ncbi:GL12343 [Drosophila persimilis]|uniref:GL12343 n=1 Tax=Drosophila persimilis TaxID=7234 RepID=B4GM86_DROPE|nr:GL12343 [Drosophila persimilis]
MEKPLITHHASCLGQPFGTADAVIVIIIVKSQGNRPNTRHPLSGIDDCSVKGNTADAKNIICKLTTSCGCAFMKHWPGMCADAGVHLMTS